MAEVTVYEARRTDAFAAKALKTAATLCVSDRLRRPTAIRSHFTAGTATAVASAGLYLQWVRGTALHGKAAGMVEALGTALNGVLIFTFSRVWIAGSPE